MREDPLSNKYRPQRWLYEPQKEQRYWSGVWAGSCESALSGERVLHWDWVSPGGLFLGVVSRVADIWEWKQDFLSEWALSERHWRKARGVEREGGRPLCSHMYTYSVPSICASLGVTGGGPRWDPVGQLAVDFGQVGQLSGRDHLIWKTKELVRVVGVSVFRILPVWGGPSRLWDVDPNLTEWPAKIWPLGVAEGPAPVSPCHPGCSLRKFCCGRWIGAWTHQERSTWVGGVVAVLVSEGWRNKSPQTGWLTIVQSYSLIVLTARSAEWRCQQGHTASTFSRGDSCLAPCGLSCLQALLGSRWHHSSFCLCLHLAFSFRVFSYSVSFKDTYHWI